MAGPLDAGGAGLGAAELGEVTAALGGASLTTAFVWVQHHSAVRAVSAARPAMRDRWLGPMCAGEVRSGVAIAALRRPGPPAMRAAATPSGGVVLDGWAPWVTGWGRIDTVLVGAREGDDIVWCLINAAPGATVHVERLRLAAVDASCTVELRLDRHEVGADRVVSREPYAGWRARDAGGLAGNGFLAVGLVERCARLLDAPALLDQAGAVRRGLLDADAPAGVVAARADGSLLAVRASTALVVAGGGKAVGLDDHAQRLAREAMFLLVFGQTGPIRAAQTRLLGTAEG